MLRPFSTLLEAPGDQNRDEQECDGNLRKKD